MSPVWRLPSNRDAYDVTRLLIYRCCEVENEKHVFFTPLSKSEKRTLIRKECHRYPPAPHSAKHIAVRLNSHTRMSSSNTAAEVICVASHRNRSLLPPCWKKTFVCVSWVELQCAYGIMRCRWVAVTPLPKALGSEGGVFIQIITLSRKNFWQKFDSCFPIERNVA